MHRQVLPFAICILMALGGRDAAAQVGQPWTDRGYVNINAGFESASGDLNDATTFRLYDEDASLSVAHAVDSGSLVDLGAGIRVWRNVSLGLGFHRGSTHGEAAVQASVPNPLFFNRYRAAAVSVADLDRTEQAVHLQFGYMLPLSDKMNVHIVLGPSFFRLKQEVTSGISVTEQGFPFTSVTAQPTVVERTDSPVGFNIGADISYEVYDAGAFQVGAGMLIRYAGASADVIVIRNAVDSDLGGLQIGFGGRVRF